MFTFIQSVWARCVTSVQHAVETVKSWFARKQSIAEPTEAENPIPVADQSEGKSSTETTIIAQLETQLSELFATTFNTRVLAEIGVGVYRRLYQQITDPAVRQQTPQRPDHLRIIRVGRCYRVVDAASVVRRNGKLVTC